MTTKLISIATISLWVSALALLWAFGFIGVYLVASSATFNNLIA